MYDFFKEEILLEQLAEESKARIVRNDELNGLVFWWSLAMYERFQILWRVQQWLFDLTSLHVIIK